MKVAIISLGLLVLIAMVKSESCQMASDCQNLACAGSEFCENGICTCKTQTQPQSQCTLRSDCAQQASMSHCRKDSVHCVDGRCRCAHH